MRDQRAARRCSRRSEVGQPGAGSRGSRRRRTPLGVGDAAGPPQSGCRPQRAHQQRGDGEEPRLERRAGDGALGDAPVDQAGDEAEGAGVGLVEGGAGLGRRRAARKSARWTCWSEAGVHPVGGQPPPADGDDVAQHRLERALGVEGLERGVGAGVPVGGEAGVEVVLGGEVAVDRALGVFGAVGDLLDGDRLPVVAVDQRDRRRRAAPARARSSSRLLRSLVPIGVPPRDLRSRETAAAVVNRS